MVNINTLKNIISTLKKGGDFKITYQNFSNEIIFQKNLSGTILILGEVKLSNCDFKEVDFTGSHFIDCNFENCKFHNTILHKCEFWNCTFKNCEILGCMLTKADLDNNVFTNCQFKKVDFGWSHFMDCEFLETRLDDINFEATVISDLKTKNATVLNLHFNERFPMSFWKLKECSKVKDSLSFEKFLRDTE